MKNKNAVKIGAVFLVVIMLGVGIVLRFGFGGNVAHESTAMIARAWHNLFGAASYDVSIDENASDTAFDDATSSIDTTSTTIEGDQEGLPALPAVKSSPPKKKTSVSKNDAVLQNHMQSSSDQMDSQFFASSSQETQQSDETFASSTITTVSSTTTTTTATTSSTIVASSCSYPPSSAPLSKNIIMNEIAWMGSPPVSSETVSAAADDEWMELKNNSTDDVLLAGWTVLDGSGGIKINFAAGDHIPAGGFFLLARGTGGAVSPIAQKIYSGTLSNSGDELAVLDPQCNVSDFLDASSGWPGGDNTTKQTLERNEDTVGWHTSASPGGTPGAENSLGIPAQQASSTAASTTPPTNTSGNGNPPPGGVGTDNPPAPLPVDASSTNQTACTPNHVVIASVQILGAASSNDFVKLYNPTSAAIDMSGWKLRKKSQTGTDSSLKALGSGSVIAPGSYFVWANSANGFAQTVGADVSSSETLAANNSVALLDASGTIVDEVAWGAGTSQYVEGIAFATNPAANQMLERNFVDGVIVDTDDNAADFALH